MRDIDALFTELAKSDFRSRFRLNGKDRIYFETKGMEEILVHAGDFIRTRLAPADIPNDGKQTPLRNHPVFVAQHATATCCRKCLQKWHHIPKSRALTDWEMEYIVSVIERWLKNGGRLRP
jgi:hypothetical protein